MMRLTLAGDIRRPPGAYRRPVELSKRPGKDKPLPGLFHGLVGQIRGLVDYLKGGHPIFCVLTAIYKPSQKTPPLAAGMFTTLRVSYCLSRRIVISLGLSEGVECVGRRD